MKDNRFIELVNLYIDRQITADETAELEAEIQSSPDRRAVYRQYCQMHSATKQVYGSFRDHASEPAAGQSLVRNKVVGFEGRLRQRPSRWTYYAGGLAAAACLTLVLVRMNSGQSPTSAAGLMANLNQPKAASVAAVAPASLAAVASLSKAVQPPVGLLSLRNVAAEPDYSALLAAMRREEQRAFASGQVQSGGESSLFEDGVFDGPQSGPANSGRIYGKRQTPAQQAEFTAFQFQR